MHLKNEQITHEEIEEIEATEAMMKAERADFHQEILEWMTMEQVLYNLHDIPYDEAEREEAYAYNKSIAYEFLLER